MHFQYISSNRFNGLSKICLKQIGCFALRRIQSIKKIKDSKVIKGEFKLQYKLKYKYKCNTQHTSVVCSVLWG